VCCVEQFVKIFSLANNPFCVYLMREQIIIVCEKEEEKKIE
jgi:hypothetical protein